MVFTETFLKGCFIIEPFVLADSRGYFFESFHLEKFKQNTGQTVNFVQDNQSLSKYGVIRGLHIQRPEYAQSKLVRVLKGRILDVAVDGRKYSETFGQCFSIELSAENNKQLFLPEGFLHGFSVLSEEAVVLYKCNRVFNKASEDGVNPLDSVLNIDWQISADQMILSEKDRNAQRFKDFNPF